MKHNRGIYSVMAGLALTGLVAQGVQADAFNLHPTIIFVNTDGESSPAILDLDVDNDVAVALDGTYFVTPNIGINVLATFLSFDVTSAGVSLGSVDDLPPIVTAQYHFSPNADVRPYIGVGFNYNIFSDETGALVALGAEVENTIGFVANAGLDYMINKTVSLNLDVKYLTFDADVNVASAPALNDELEVDAWIIGIGLGMHF